MKTKEELNALKNEVETLNKKLAELNEEELKAVTGGNSWGDYWGEGWGGSGGSGGTTPPTNPGGSGSGKWSDYWGSE